MKWSKYQRRIFDRVADTDDHIVIDAVAGSGKSTTLFKIASLMPDYDILFFAFNKHIEQYATKKLSPIGVKVQTTHAYGLSCLRASGKFKNAELNFNKVWECIEANVKNFKLRGSYYNAITSLRTFGCMDYSSTGIVKFVKSNPTIISQIGDAKILSNAATIGSLLQKLDNDTSSYDFDDMIRFPIIYDLIKFGYQPEVLLVDEAQDLNTLQFEYLKFFLKNNVRIIAVGDEAQAIYGFRGSDGNSLSTIREMAQAERMPLSITYRCKSNIVQYCKNRYARHNDEVPSIKAYEEGGMVTDIVGSPEDIYSIKTLLDNKVEMVVSAKNKHIISIWFDLLEQYGVSSSLKGSKITAMLTKMFKSLKSDTPFANAGLSLLSLSKSEDEEVADMAATCYRFMLIQKFTGYDEIFDRIKKLEQDTTSKIHLHTVHSAKGMEAEKIFLIDDWFDSDQKANMEYVGITRASDHLFMVRPYVPQRKVYQ